jgi:hypothetical protein
VVDLIAAFCCIAAPHCCHCALVRLAVHGCSPVVRGTRMSVADLVPNNTLRVMLALYG